MAWMGLQIQGKSLLEAVSRVELTAWVTVFLLIGTVNWPVLPIKFAISNSCDKKIGIFAEK